MIVILGPASVTVQPGLCQTCSETTLLVFPRGGSYDNNNFNFLFKFELTNSVCYLSSRFVPVYTLQLGLCIYMKHLSYDAANESGYDKN